MKAHRWVTTALTMVATMMLVLGVLAPSAMAGPKPPKAWSIYQDKLGPYTVTTAVPKGQTFVSGPYVTQAEAQAILSTPPTVVPATTPTSPDGNNGWSRLTCCWTGRLRTRLASRQATCRSLGLVADLWGKTRSVTRDTGMPKTRSRDRSNSSRIRTGGRAPRRIQKGSRHRRWCERRCIHQSPQECRWHDVTTERDFARIVETFETAVERRAAALLIGFALRGRPHARRVGRRLADPSWGRAPEQLPPGVAPSTRAFDTRLSGCAFVENPDAKASELRPSRFADRPWFLTDYPCRVSWRELGQVAERPVSMDN